MPERDFKNYKEKGSEERRTKEKNGESKKGCKTYFGNNVKIILKHYDT